MPPRLSAVLAGLGVEASPGEFAAVESLLGGSFSGLGDARGNPAARIDAADLTSGEVTEWLSRLSIGQGAELQVAWVADLYPKLAVVRENQVPGQIRVG